MGWSTHYDQEYIDAAKAYLASAKAYGDADTVNDAKAYLQNAIDKFGQPINP